MILLVLALLAVAAGHAWHRGARWWAVVLLAAGVPTAVATLGLVVALAVLLVYGAVSVTNRERPTEV